MKFKKCSVTLMTGICFIFIISGCITKKTYTYNDITEEYAEVICNLGPLESGRGNETCDLNQAISLSDAIKVSLANNPDNKMAIARIKQASAMTDKANAAFLPSVGFYAEYMKGDAPSGYLFKKIDQRDLPAQTNFNDPGSIENYETGINVRMNLFNGGRDILNKQIAETGLGISQLDRQSVENSLVAAVINAYYDALAARDYIKIAEESVSTVKAQLKIMQVRFKAGGALKSDILSLEVRLAMAREDVVRSKNRLKTALTALSNILGISPDRELRLKETDMQPVKFPAEYLEGLEHGLRHRPEVRKMRKQVIQSRMALDIARSGYLPSVNLQGRYYVDDSSPPNDLEGDNWTAAIVFNWELLNGFNTRADEKKASARLEQILAADRQTVLSLKLDIKNAYIKLEEAKARLDVARTSVAMAEESLSLVKKQYEGGSATITRYLEAELDLNRARMRSATAFYDREKAVANIGKAIGYWGFRDLGI